MNYQKAEIPRFLTDEEEWKEILRDIHSENIPIEIHRKNRGLAELYANHVPAELYVKHSYTALKRSLQTYMEQFQSICHKTLENKIKKYEILQEHEQIIKLGLQEIIEELAFLNVKPISQILHLLNTLIFRTTSNFLNFVNSVQKMYFSSFERKKQAKESLNNLCPDCKMHREQGLLKNLKRKLNLNKTQLMPVQYQYNSNSNTSKNNDRQIEAKIINDFVRVKHQAAQNLRLEQQRQLAWLEHENKVSKFNSKSSNLADEIFMNEKEAYIQQLNDLLEGREVHQTSNTNAYSYLINELMEFPHLDKLHEERYSKQAEKITQKIQNYLFENFMTTLSDPLKLVLRKVVGKKHVQEHYFEFHPKSLVSNKVSVEVQTSSNEFESILKNLQKELLKKNYEMNCIKKNKDELEKKYFEKYQEQRENHKQLHQNFITIKDLKQQLQQIKEENQILNQKLEKQISIQAETMKKMETEHQKTLTLIDFENEKKCHQYRQQINQEVEKKIKKINEEKEKQINCIKYHSQFELKALTSLNQSFETLKTNEKDTQKSFKKIAVSQCNILKKNGSIKEIFQNNNKEFLKTQNDKHENKILDFTKKRISYDSLDISKKQQDFPELKHIQSKSYQSKRFPKGDSPSINDSDEFGEFSKASQYQNLKQDSFKSIDMMVKLHQNKNQSIYKSLNQQKKFQRNVFNFMEEEDQFPDQGWIMRKTTNEMDVQKEASEAIQTEKYSPNKNFSMRKFRKINKEVQFSFSRKQNETDGSSSMNQNEHIKKSGTEKQYGKMKKQDESQNSGKENTNTNFKRCPNIKKTITTISAQSRDKKPAIKSGVKFKNIALEQEYQISLQNLKDQNGKNSYRKPLQSTYKSLNGTKKYLAIHTNQSLMKSSLIKLEGSQSQSKVKFQDKELGQTENWRPELDSKEYDLDQVKLILEKEFQYFKLTGILQKIYSLEENEQKNIKERILTVAKRRILSNNKKFTNPKTKDPFLKSHQTLKSILSRSINKFHGQSRTDLDEMTKKQIETLSEDFLKEINEVQTFSDPTVEDLQLFGGMQKGKKIDVSNFYKQESALVVQNNVSHAFDYGLLEYFKKLQDLNREKYIMYTNFLKYPTSYLNGNLSKIAKKSKKTISQEYSTFQNDINSLKWTISNIFAFHEKEHHQKCIHLQKFLKKIGYFKYSVNQIN